MRNLKISISDKHKDLCQHGLQWLRENSCLSAEGKMQTDLSVASMAAEELIASSVKIEPDFPERTKRRVIRLALNRWRRCKKYFDARDQVQAFQDALAVEIRFLERKAIQYTILMFLNLDPPSGFESLAVRGHTLQFRTWGELDNLSIADLWKEVRFKDRENPIIRIYDGKAYPRIRDFTPVTLELETYDVPAAVEIASERLDLLRAVLNFLPAIRVKFRWGKPQPLSKFLPSPIYGVFDRNGVLLAPYYTIERYKYKYHRQRIEEQDREAITELLQTINQAQEGSVSYLILKLLLYQQALDLTDHRAIYLALWQVLETAVERGEGKIESRIKALTQPDEFLEAVLESLAEHRNRLVHSGVFPKGVENLVFILKGFVDFAIRRIIYLSKHLSTESELGEFLKHLTLGDSTLERRRKVIGFIQSQRSKG